MFSVSAFCIASILGVSAERSACAFMDLATDDESTLSASADSSAIAFTASVFSRANCREALPTTKRTSHTPELRSAPIIKPTQIKSTVSFMNFSFRYPSGAREPLLQTLYNDTPRRWKNQPFRGCFRPGIRALTCACQLRRPEAGSPAAYTTLRDAMS